MQANLLVLYSEGFELAVSLFQFKAGSETYLLWSFQTCLGCLSSQMVMSCMGDRIFQDD